MQSTYTGLQISCKQWYNILISAWADGVWATYCTGYKIVLVNGVVLHGTLPPLTTKARQTHEAGTQELCKILLIEFVATILVSMYVYTNLTA